MTIDLLTATWNTLPWLRLLASQVDKLRPNHPCTLHVWEGGSLDGTAEWLQGSGLSYHLSQERTPHARSLMNLVDRTRSEYIATIDVDAIPIEAGWLDDAMVALENPKVGAVGLKAGGTGGYHRHFVHPAFCVFRREVYMELGLSFEIVHDFSRNTAFDVGEMFCQKLEDSGRSLVFLGPLNINPEKIESKVAHFGMSTMGLSKGDPSWAALIGQVVRGHRRLLDHFGLWAEFKSYLSDASSVNPACLRYLS